jgi:L-threonylcarbamoyladenylate synthase
MASANAARYAVCRVMRVLSVDPRRPDAAAVLDAARVLRSGGLVVFPTETVYGLGGRALDESAIERIFLAKGRPRHHPLIAHVAAEEGARALAERWPSSAARLARVFWPGPLTIVVTRASFVPAALAGGSDSIALRAPDHPVALALLEALGEPIAAPSANRYQSLSPTRAAHAIKQLAGAVDLVLDGGACAEGIESTVVDVRGAAPRVLRPGAVPIASLREVVPDVEFRVECVDRQGPRAAPGMDRRHYAPRAPLLLADHANEARQSASALAMENGRVGLVTLERPRPQKDDEVSLPTRILQRVMPRDPQRYAKELYATLHELDEQDVRAIVVERVPLDEAWSAVADRLVRAASKS